MKDFRTLQWFDAVAYWNHDAPPAKTDWFPKVMQWQCVTNVLSDLPHFRFAFSAPTTPPHGSVFFEGAVGAQPNPLTSQAFGRRQDAPAVHGQVSAAEFEAAEARLAQRRGAAGAAGAPP